MHHDIHGEGDAMLPDAARQFQLGGMRARAGDLIGLGLLGILEAELEVIEAGFDQRFQARLREPDSRGDQIDVQPCRSSGLDQLLRIRPRQRLATGQMQLQSAQGRRFAEHALPFRRGQFVGA